MAEPKNPGKSKTGASKRDTLKSLREDLSKVESRLKAADRATRKSVEAMEESMAILSLRVNGVNGEELRENAQLLSAKLQSQMERAQTEIKQTLQAQLADPKIDRMHAAIQMASKRLQTLEVQQAEQIAKINQHIARLASVMDNRLQSQAREISSTRAELKQAAATLEDTRVELHSRIEARAKDVDNRITDIEANSAEAITGIGERVAELSGELTRRMDSLDGSIAERVYEVALDNQRELEVQKSAADRRLEQMEDNQRNTLAPVQQSLATVFARLEALEAGLGAGFEPAGLNSVPPMPDAQPNDPQALELQDMAEAPLELETTEQAEDKPSVGLLARIGLGGSKTKQDDAFSPPPEEHYSEPISAPYPQAVGHDVQTDYAGYDAYNQTPQMPPQMPSPYGSPAQMQQYAAEAFGNGQIPPNPYAQHLEPQQNHYAPQGSLPLLDPSSDPMNMPTMEQELYPIEQMSKSMQAARPAGDSVPVKNSKSRLLRTAITAAALIGVVSVGGLMLKDRLADGQTAQTPAKQSGAAEPSLAAGDNGALTPPALDVTKTEPTGQMTQPEASPAAQMAAQPVEAPPALKSAVEAGNPIAQYHYGLGLLRGGEAEAGANYMRLAASQNMPVAQYILSHLYDTGEGVTRDPDMARDLAMKAAQGGHRLAMYDLAVYYVDDAENGNGDPAQNMARAASWFEKAAEFGMTDAQFNIATLYEQGNGVPSDAAEAYVWYTIAGNQGDQESAAKAAQMREDLSGDILERADAKIASFVPAQINAQANGIFPPQAWEQQNVSGRAVNPQNVEVQQLLTTLGYDIGAVDGIIGSKSRDAIRDFERANGMPETGQISDPLVQRMRAAAQA